MSRNLYHGAKIEDTGAAMDAKICIEALMRSYPLWQLRRAGQADRIQACNKSLHEAIVADDIETVCRLRLELRQAQHSVEQAFGVRYIDENGEEETPQRSITRRPVSIGLGSFR